MKGGAPHARVATSHARRERRRPSDNAAGKPVKTIREVIRHNAGLHPQAPFLIAPESGSTLSFGALRASVDEVAGRLYGLGLEPGAKAAFLLDNGCWTALLFLGTMHAGLVSVPLNAVAGPDTLAFVLAHADVEVLFVSSRYAEHVACAVATLENRVTVIATDEDAGPQWPERAVSPPASAAGLQPSSPALLLYTSGTTGVPKGVLLSHRNLIAGGRNTVAAHGLGPSDRALCVLPLYHINGEVVTVMGPLVSAGSVVMPHRFRASRFWSLVATHRCTWFSVVPTIIHYLLDRAAEERYRFGADADLAQLRFGRSASAPLAASVHRRFESTFAIPMIETMGLTETAAPILSNPMPPAPRKPGSPGVPVGNLVEVASETGELLGVGEVGELIVKGDNVLRGYYKNEQATRSAFTASGWFRTGDLGYRDEDGYFFITGRLKELIIKGGENIAPREIDDVLYQHPAVLEAAAVGVADARYGQDVVACVRLRENVRCPATELIAHCERHLGQFKSPQRIYFMAELPKGPSGKIQRLKLPALIAERCGAPPG